MSVYGNMKSATLTGYKSGALNQLNESSLIEFKTVTNYRVAIYSKSKTYITENGVRYDLAVITGISTTSPELAECNELFIEQDSKKYKVKSSKGNARYYVLELEEVS